MKYFCVVAMSEKPEIAVAAEKIKKYLEDRGCVCSVNSGYAKRENIPFETECAIVLGGDGTLLQAARELLETRIRLIGINFGNLGFLAEVEKDSIETALDRLITDQFTVEKRMLLNGSIIRDDKVVYENVALNDIVINRSSLMRVMQLKISVNHLRLSEYNADGIIIAADKNVEMARFDGIQYVCRRTDCKADGKTYRNDTDLSAHIKYKKYYSGCGG